jgi:hypothetical protein
MDLLISLDRPSQEENTMKIPSAPDRSQKLIPAKELLLADHKYFSESFWKSEETGERRVTILTTLIAAAITAIAAMLKQGTGADYLSILGISIFASGSVVILGIMMWLRISKGINPR